MCVPYVFQLPHTTEGKVYFAKCGNIALRVVRGCEILSQDSSASKGRSDVESYWHYYSTIILVELDSSSLVFLCKWFI